MKFLIVVIGALLFMFLCYRQTKMPEKEEKSENPENYRPTLLSRTILHGDMIMDMFESFRKDHAARKNQKVEAEKAEEKETAEDQEEPEKTDQTDDQEDDTWVE